MTAVRTPGNPARIGTADIGAIAQVAHEANRAYCATIGDLSQPAWEDAPAWQRTSAIEGVQNILIGTVKVPQDSHASWSAHKLREGWKYGPVKDPEKKEHPCLVPFAQLPPEQQAKDRLFFGIVKALLGTNPVVENGAPGGETSL